MGSTTSSFVEIDGVEVLQHRTDVPATLPLDAVDAELLRGFDIQETRNVKIGSFEMGMFANSYSRYLREAGEVTKVGVIHFANLLLRDKILTRVTQRETRESATSPCVYGRKCPICKGRLTHSVCRSAIVATIEVQDILIGLTTLVARKSMKLDEEQEYFWPTRRFLERLRRKP